MAYFVTGATGFLGRFLVQELLDNRDGQVYVLVRPGSEARAERLLRRWGHESRVSTVAGDLADAVLGVSSDWVAEHSGGIDHFFHLAALHDLTAGDEECDTLNVGGTRNALELAADLDAGLFHHVSSVAVSGDYAGFYDETMFDVGQQLPSPYHRTKHESERVVREESAVPWRVYRPSTVIGHSVTGETDKVDGPYYFFPLLKGLRDFLPSWTPLVGVDLGDTNIVPVDFVAKAIDHLAHLPGRDGEAFHLVAPQPQRTIDVVNVFAKAAHAPQFATPVDRDLTGLVPAGLLPGGVRPGRLVRAALRSVPARFALRETVGRLGLPPEVVEDIGFPSTYGAHLTQEALAGSGIQVPDLDSYADRIWSFWEERLDESLARDEHTVGALRGRTVVITGASSGIGSVTAHKVARAGAVPVLVARNEDALQGTKEAIEDRGGTAYAFACDLTDLAAVDDLTHRLTTEVGAVDFLVNNAGRSTRRSVELSEGRFDDVEGTMQVNYFGTVRLVMGLLPAMRAQQHGHVVNVSTTAVVTSPPGFSAYVASKAALDAWSNVVASEVAEDGITFSTVHLPLVRTPMAGDTEMHDRFPAITPAQAAELIVRALVDRPQQIDTAVGTLGAVAHTLAPRAVSRVQQLLLARPTRGVHL